MGDGGWVTRSHPKRYTLCICHKGDGAGKGKLKLVVCLRWWHWSCNWAQQLPLRRVPPLLGGKPPQHFSFVPNPPPVGCLPGRTWPMARAVRGVHWHTLPGEGKGV